jgi:hypothetical protein
MGRLDWAGKVLVLVEAVEGGRRLLTTRGMRMTAASDRVHATRFSR